MDRKPINLHLVKNEFLNDGICYFEDAGRRMFPLNEAARVVCDLVGMTALPTYKLEDLRKLGFKVEVKK